MINKVELSNTDLFKEMTEEDIKYWFDYKQKKFLHNIDTFYYSVKFVNDFRADTKDHAVLRFRKKMEKLKDAMKFGDSVCFYLDSIGCNLNLVTTSYGKFYNICLQCPEYFDIFIASKTPPASDGTESITCEVVVQLRSYLLWMHGIHGAFEYSMKYMQAICDQFGFQVAYVQENRIDYCWHSNYLVNPEKFFAPDNFYNMRVSRIPGGNWFHTSPVGSDGYEIDYINAGTRSSSTFLRIYLKSKEVVEKGYKAFFFKVWFFNGLINRYDLYCYEKAYIQHSWKYMTVARLEYYSEFGQDEQSKRRCLEYVYQYQKTNIVTDAMLHYADLLTPKIHLVVNVEYQTMRKATKTYQVLPICDNSMKGAAKRIYDYLDNRLLYVNYLTHDIFRLVEPSGDSHKYRREDCAFWKALRSTRLVDMHQLPDDIKMIRIYTRQMNKQAVKNSLIHKAVLYGFYTKGMNNDSPMQDAMNALLRMNDNDIVNATRYKEKKARQLNENELSGLVDDDVSHNFVLVDQKTGAIYDNDTMDCFNCQDDDWRECDE